MSATTEVEPGAGGHAETCDLLVSGMSCSACVGHVEKALRAVPGVSGADVNLLAGRATVHLSSAGVPVEALVKAVHEAGYEAEPDLPDEMAAAHGAHDHGRAAAGIRKVAFAALLTIPVVLMDMGGHFHLFPMPWVMAPWWGWAQFLLTTPVVFWAGRGFFTGAYQAAKQRTSDMNTLIALGTFTAWAWSSAATFAPDFVKRNGGGIGTYYETAAVIITLILTGELMESLARNRASTSMNALLNLQPATALVVTSEGESEVPAAQVQVGALLRVKPGSRIPTDGVVVSGESWVDESMLTGESAPARKMADAQVTGGTQNGEGSFVMRASAVGSHTALARIVKLVQQAQASRAPVQRLADRVTAVFVPAVVGFAAVTFAVWMLLGPQPRVGHAITAVVAVLIIACPCALGLATPTAVMVGATRAAKLGLLFKSAEALERLASVKAIVLDKTGTVTEGHPALVETVVAAPFTEATALALAAAVERSSEHPYAKAITDAAASRGYAVPDAQGFAAIAGRGAKAVVNGQQVSIGSLGLITEMKAAMPPELAAAAERHESAGVTPLLMAVEGSAVAMFAVADPLKPTASSAIARLQALGLNVSLLTGDRAAVAGAVAQKLGITSVVSETMPENKAAEIARLQKEFGAVAMVGDGINDAPALSSADVGIAIGAGTDIAIESAAVILTGTDLNAVADAVELARATMRNIRQNLAFAFGYNIVCIPLAGGVFYLLTGAIFNPVVGSVAMALSDISVIGNAMRLIRFQPRRA